MIVLKILGILVLLAVMGFYGIFKFIKHQENVLFFKHNYIHKKSKDKELYDELNPIWKDR